MRRARSSVWRAADAGAGATAPSPREREIAELAAAGRTNKEVAATLFISDKTVENALSRVYEKLGVRGRVELVAALSAGG